MLKKLKRIFTVCITGFVLSSCTTNLKPIENIQEQSEYNEKIETIQSTEIAINTISKQNQKGDITMNLKPNQQVALDSVLNFISIPKDYVLVNVNEGAQDNENIIVFRYQKNEELNIGGEHFSFTVREKDNLLLGVMWMDSKFIKDNELPTKEQTSKIAEEYIKKIDPDLFNKLELQWISSHDEKIIIDNKEIVVSGMKYKCYIPAEKTYTWVVVGSGGDVTIFERGLVWDGVLGQRGSEGWLYDTWVKDRPWLE